MMKKLFLYAEFQVSVPFDQIDWASVNTAMKQYEGLRSKTWLSGLGNNSVGGFYEFDTLEHAQYYIDNLLLPTARQLGGNLSVKLFDGEVTTEASVGMASPFYVR